jgi:hypothetical protein
VGGAGAAVGTLRRYEDLWQSPIGDVSHAFNVRPALRCSLPTFQCSAWLGNAAGVAPRRGSKHPLRYSSLLSVIEAS